MSRVWLITGCSSGFGRMLVEKLLPRGECVAATAREVAQLEGLGPAGGEGLLCAPLDVTRGAQIRRAVELTLARFGRIDVLVNNAGYGYFSLQEDGDIDEIRRLFETNVFGLIRLTQAVLPAMRQAGSGVVVNLSSVAGRVAFPRSGFYNASKFAVEALSEALYYEVAPLGIRTVIVEPGSFATDFVPRSAVREEKMNHHTSPYDRLNEGWNRRMSQVLVKGQDPAQVVAGIIEAVDSDRPFQRLPLGQDAEMLIGLREGRSDREFMAAMHERFGLGVRL
jgi:NAD(P)-dependent dehydrogenase (short-subunit alcohol dehydrogenase family)